MQGGGEVVGEGLADGGHPHGVAHHVAGDLEGPFRAGDLLGRRRRRDPDERTSMINVSVSPALFGAANPSSTSAIPVGWAKTISARLGAGTRQ